MLNIDKLLKKKGWTGAELGRLELANTMIGYKNALEGNNPDAQGLISEADFQKMLATIKDPYEGRVYNNYLSIHDWIANTIQMAISQEQQAQFQLYRLFTFMSNASIAEDLYQYIEQLPIILTEKQYKELEEKTKEEALHLENGEDMKFCPLDLIKDAIDYFVDLLNEKPKAKNPLKPLKKKLEKEKVNNPRILSLYRKDGGLGYFTMKDGTNSKNTPSEEWKAKALKELGKILKPYNLTEKALVLFAGAITENNNLLFKTILHLTLPYCSSKKSLIAEITGKIEEAFSWEVDEEAPTEPTKWELLEDRVIYSYYAFSEAPEGEDVEIVKEFIKDFPEVTEVIKKDIIENFPDLKPVLEAPIEEWIYTWGTFTDLGKHTQES